MCGIFGWAPSALFKNSDFSAVAREQMKLLRHRGPNDAGYALFGDQGMAAGPRDRETHSIGTPELLFVHTRLSILDLSPAGKQPMFSADGRYCIVFNGEIYNYIELRRELAAKGVRFRSDSDTEVLLYALACWGEKAILRLNGMFAFAFYDTHSGALLCVRDFFGIKPLYWSNGENGFSFGSELPALLAVPGANRGVDRVAAYYFLELGIENFGGSCMAAGVELLPAGHLLRLNVKRGLQPEVERYWRIPLGKPRAIAFPEAVEEVRRLFLQNIKLNLRSDVPLGVALSGGIDSTSVAWAVRHLCPDTELHTFSFIAEGEDISEKRWVDIALKGLGARNHTTSIGPQDLPLDFDAFIQSAGEPTASSSYYAQYKLFQLVRASGIVVSLEGQGADEMLAGYSWYIHERFLSLLNKRHFRDAEALLGAMGEWPDLVGYQPELRAMLEARSRPVALLAKPLAMVRTWRDAVWGTSQVLPNSDWLNTELVGEIPSLSPWTDGGYASRDTLRQSLATSLTWYTLNAQLLRGDHFAMAASVESRVPFCSRDLAEFLLSLPETFLLDDTGRSKSVFREAMRGITPDAILDRKRKLGFETPGEKDCLALSDTFEEVFAAAKDDPFIHVSEIRNRWKEMRSGERPFDWSVWRAASFLRWKQLYALTC